LQIGRDGDDGHDGTTAAAAAAIITDDRYQSSQSVLDYSDDHSSHRHQFGHGSVVLLFPIRLRHQQDNATADNKDPARRHVCFS
jgi:hypothetical protein